MENQCRSWAAALDTFSYTTLAADDPQAAGTLAAQRVVAEGDFALRDFYVVGPAAFVTAVQGALTAAGLPAQQLIVEVL
jgi:ferredoxin-NADP reductase